MYHKYLSVFIWGRSRKFFFINELNFLDDGQSFYSRISLLFKLFLYKPYVCIGKIEKDMPRTTLILVIANKKVFLNN